MTDFNIMPGGVVTLPGPHRADPVLSGSQGWWRYHAGLDLGQAQDPSALAIIEDTSLPMVEYDRHGRQRLTDRALTVVHADRLPSVRYGDLARHVTSVQSRGPLQGRCSLTVDATGVGRSFSDVLDEGGADHNRVQITAGANVARSGRFWNVSKLVLLADLASHLETGRLHIAGDLPLADELRREFDSFQVSQSAAGNQIVEVAARGHHGDMVIAVALALFGATRARPGFTGEGQLEGWFG